MTPTGELLLNLIKRDIIFFIPPYQRNYSWEIDQCKIFFDDVVSLYKKNMKLKVDRSGEEHFFGTLVYRVPERPITDTDSIKYVLIDGQQRITTTMLFLAALRDSINNDEIKNDINEKYLKGNDGQVYKIKLKQVESDSTTYEKIINNEVIENRTRSLIFENYSYFCRQVKEFLKNNDSLFNTEHFNEFLELGLGKFRILPMGLNKEYERPQDIFESMNSIGKPLTLADMVRNYLLMGLCEKRQVDLYSKYWIPIEQNLQEPKNVSFFIRDYMQMTAFLSDISGLGDIKQPKDNNNKELYYQFKNIFQNIENTDEFLDKLKVHSAFYSMIICERSTGDEKVDKYIRYIYKYLKTSTTNSLLLFLLSEWKVEGRLDTDSVRNILHCLFIFVIRRRLCGLGSVENKCFPKYIREMDNLIAEDSNFKDEKECERVFYDICCGQEYNMRLPNDNELSNTLEDINFYSNDYSKFLLCLVEETFSNQDAETLMNDRNLTKEHIMPQGVETSNWWKNELGNNWREIRDRYINNIGNITLIRHNQELGAASFEEKSEIYSGNENLCIARKMIINDNSGNTITEWTEKEITNRRDWIIDYIVTKVIPIPKKYRIANNYSNQQLRGRKKGSPIKYFTELNIEKGTSIRFIHKVEGNFVDVKVADVDGSKVEYNGKTYDLSTITRELMNEIGKGNESGSYQGAKYFTYNGKTIAELYQERNN